MNDLAYFVAILAIGVSGFVLGRVQRQHRYRAEAAANLARSLANSNKRRDARAHANRYVIAQSDGDGDTGPDSDGDPDSYGGSPRVNQAGRRAIYGPDNRVRTGPAAARGARRRANETALAVAGYDG